MDNISTQSHIDLSRDDIGFTFGKSYPYFDASTIAQIFADKFTYPNKILESILHISSCMLIVNIFMFLLFMNMYEYFIQPINMQKFTYFMVKTSFGNK